MSWKEMEQELIKQFGANYFNYPMSVEFYVKSRKWSMASRIENNTQSKSSGTKKTK